MAASKGFVKFPNELFDKLLTAELTGGELKVLLAIVRQTLGFNVDAAPISLSLLQKMTGLSRGTICDVLTALKSKNIISAEKRVKNSPQVIGVNADTSVWKVFAPPNTKCSAGRTQVVAPPNTSVRPAEHILYKDIYKDSFTDSVLKTGADAPSAHTTSTKKIFGYFENVLLTDSEYQKLAAEIPNVDEYINHFSEYLESSGKEYNSHFATIRLWYHDDVKKQKTQPKPNPAVDDDGESSFDMDEWYKQALGYDPEKISFK